MRPVIFVRRSAGGGSSPLRILFFDARACSYAEPELCARCSPHQAACFYSAFSCLAIMYGHMLQRTMPPRCSSMLTPTGKPEADDRSGGGRHLAQRCRRAPLPTPPVYEACCRFHPAAGVFLLDLGCSKIMTIASVSVMKMITITMPRGVTIGSGFRTMRGGAT